MILVIVSVDTGLWTVFYRNEMDIEAMQKAGKLFVGKHDFRNFCKMDVVNVNNFCREIYSVSIAPIERETTEDTVDGVWTIDISGSAFLWHQIRFMMAVLFRIGRGEEDYTVIADLLDIEKCDGKPQYLMASHLPLVLYDCEFDEKDADFEWNRGGGEMQTVDIATTLHMLWRENYLTASVQRLFWKHSAQRVVTEQGRDALNTGYLMMEHLSAPIGNGRNGKRRKKKPVKLMEMEREPSLKERLDTMKNSKLRKYKVKESLRAHFFREKEQNQIYEQSL